MDITVLQERDERYSCDFEIRFTITTNLISFPTSRRLFWRYLITDIRFEPYPDKKKLCLKSPNYQKYHWKQTIGDSLMSTFKAHARVKNKCTAFEYNTECQMSFETLIRKLLNKPTFQYPDFNETFITTIDASQFAVRNIPWGKPVLTLRVP